MSRDRGGPTAGGRPPEVTGSHARPPAPGLSGGTGLFPGEGAGYRASRGFAPSPNHGEGAPPGHALASLRPTADACTGSLSTSCAAQRLGHPSPAQAAPAGLACSSLSHA